MSDARAVEVVGEHRGEFAPVVIYADRAYARLLDNWARFATDAGVRNVVVLALDDETVDQADALGFTGCRVEAATDLLDLWIRRANLFAALAEAGVDYVHSDADALWLTDPRPMLAGIDADLVFSPSTYLPPDICEVWGLVACCGLFTVRASPASASFLHASAGRLPGDEIDQTAMNRELFDRGIRWDDTPFEWATSPAGLVFKSLAAPMIGRTDDLRVALLPERWFVRQPHFDERAMVVHSPTPPGAQAKIDLMQRMGLWRSDTP